MSFLPSPSMSKANMSAQAGSRLAGETSTAHRHRVGGSPPACRAHDIAVAVAVDVADPQAVCIAKRPWHDLALFAGHTDRMVLPQLRRLLAGSQPEHLPVLSWPLGCTPMTRTRLPSPRRSAYCGVSLRAEADHVFLPRTAVLAGVFVPLARIAGHGDDENVDPAVAVVIVGEAGEALAVIEWIEFAILADDMYFPVGRFIPDIADDDILHAVFVDVGDGDPFGAEGPVHDGLLPRDRCLGRRCLISSRRRGQVRRSNTIIPCRQFMGLSFRERRVSNDFCLAPTARCTFLGL